MSPTKLLALQASAGNRAATAFVGRLRTGPGVPMSPAARPSRPVLMRLRTQLAHPKDPDLVIQGRDLLAILSDVMAKAMPRAPRASVLGQFDAAAPTDTVAANVNVAGTTLKTRHDWWTGPQTLTESEKAKNWRNESPSYPQFSDMIRRERDERAQRLKAAASGETKDEKTVEKERGQEEKQTDYKRAAEKSIVAEMRRALAGSDAKNVNREIAMFVGVAAGAESRRNRRAYAEFVMWLDLVDAGKLGFDDALGPSEVAANVSRPPIQGKQAVAEELGISTKGLNPSQVGGAIKGYVDSLDIEKKEKKRLQSFKMGEGRWGGGLPVITSGSAGAERIDPNDGLMLTQAKEASLVIDWLELQLERDAALAQRFWSGAGAREGKEKEKKKAGKKEPPDMQKQLDRAREFFTDLVAGSLPIALPPTMIPANNPTPAAAANAPSLPIAPLPTMIPANTPAPTANAPQIGPPAAAPDAAQMQPATEFDLTKS